MLADVAAEVLRRDAVLLAVHRYAANDRCAAKVRQASTTSESSPADFADHARTPCLTSPILRQAVRSALRASVLVHR